LLYAYLNDIVCQIFLHATSVLESAAVSADDFIFT
jgi:hypothetical protein